MPISPARAAAFDILLRVERESSYASELLHSSAYESLSVPDHALATELVMGILRWRSRLDQEIAGVSSQPLSKLDLEILIALRLALYQFRWLSRIPQRAALHESVELVKRARKRSAAPFVNAVLRKLSQAHDASPLCDGACPERSRRVSSVVSNTPETLAADLAHPQWLVERWSAQFGLAAAEQICRYNQSVPGTTVRLRTPNAASELSQQKIALAPGAFLSQARRVECGDVTKTKSFRAGQVVIQDEASQLVAALVGRDLPRGTRILDCCAAPGGKTLVLADHNPEARITAVDLHPHRARVLRKLLEGKASTPAARIQIVAADARHLPFNDSFDRILVDAPCSGTGTLARNPEIKWRLQPGDLADLQHRQLAILRSALAHLAPHGRLIYSTCSLEKEENEDVIEKVPARNNEVRLLDCSTELDRLKREGDLAIAGPTSLTSGPYLRTIPGVHPCDGFFAAILEKA